MGNGIKVHISLPESVYNKGKTMAYEMGIPFSTFISVLISEKAKQEERRR